MGSRQRKSLTAEPGQPVLLSGGNPQIAKGDGDGPVQAYLAALSGWKQAICKQVDALVVETIPGVVKAVRWNSPFYGLPGQGWFFAYHVMTKYIKFTFFRGADLAPQPPESSKLPNVRYYHVAEGESVDLPLLQSWLRQAAKLPGEKCF
jgi:hypothetical protein